MFRLKRPNKVWWHRCILVPSNTMTNWLQTSVLQVGTRPAIQAGLAGLFFLIVFFWPTTIMVAGVNGQLCRLPDSGFALQWQHSVEKENWREDYRRQGNQLLLVRSRFKTYGAGTPNNGVLQAGDSGLIDYRLNRLLDELNWVVSSNVQSTLWIQGQAWPVHALLDDYSTLDVHVRRLPLWRYLLMDSCNELFRQAHKLR